MTQEDKSVFFPEFKPIPFSCYFFTYITLFRINADNKQFLHSTILSSDLKGGARL